MTPASFVAYYITTFMYRVNFGSSLKFRNNNDKYHAYKALLCNTEGRAFVQNEDSVVFKSVR